MKNISELEMQFREECTVINMDIEYPGNPGPIKWVIITGFTREELDNKYSEVLIRYLPFEISPPSTKDIIAEYNRNEDKYRYQAYCISKYSLDETANAWCLATPSFIDIQERIEEEKRLHYAILKAERKALASLTDKQRRRLIMNCVEGKSTREIAAIEGSVNHRSVCESINAAKNKFKKIFLNTLPKGTPLSMYSEEVISMSDQNTSSKSKN